MTTATRGDITKIVVSAVEHSGASVHQRRTTWTAALVGSDGREIPCGHHGHKTTKTATECGRAMWRRLPETGAPE